jgi:hypothetical protein
MLPGFRFLFAAIVLSMSILVFGLGAAALLRAAHEEFASTPAWHATPETMFAQQHETTRPVLALLRVDAPEVSKAPDNVPAVSTPVPTETAPAVVASAPVEAEAIVPPKPDNSPPPEAARPGTPVSETSPVEATSAPTEVPAAAGETKIATVMTSSSEVTPPAEITPPALPAEIARPAPEQASAAPVPPETNLASTNLVSTNLALTKIATLGGPPVTIEPPAAQKNPDKSTAGKPRQAQRAKTRRRMAQRARLTAQAPPQLADPFAQPAAPVRSR